MPESVARPVIDWAGDPGSSWAGGRRRRRGGGCGRLGFDHEAAAGDAASPIDVATDAPAIAPIHQYSFDNTFADDFGGPPLGGSAGVFTPGGFQFAADQGMVVTGAVPPSVYTIDLLFTLDQVTGYNKILDFKARGSDAGLYVFDSTLQFVVIPITGCPGQDCFTSPVVFTAATQAQVTLTRDAAGTVVGYVDRSPLITFQDGGAVGAFDAGGALAGFFLDDTVTNGTEASSGTVRRIRIYDVALTAAQVVP